MGREEAGEVLALGGLTLHHFLGDSVSPSLFRREPQGSLSARVGPVVQGPVVSPLGADWAFRPPAPEQRPLPPHSLTSEGIGHWVRGGGGGGTGHPA